MEGPAIVFQFDATVVVAARLAGDDVGTVDWSRHLVGAMPSAMDPITLELYRHRFAGVAEEMGVTLRRTGYSPNIKERLDFSCAVFDGAGHMIAQAAHIPAHLGAMPASVLTILDRFPDVGSRAMW